MSKNYRASVITSLYKAGKFINHFLEDITRQSIFEQCEFLLLDAGSPDKELEYIQPYLKHQNIKYQNIGSCSLYEAWNIGIKISSSDLITNWNVDDRRFQGSLEKQVRFLEDNSNSDICYGHTIVSHNENETAEQCQSKEVYPALDGTLENQLRHNSPHCLPVWRKSIHDRFGLFDTSYFSGSDYDMWFRVLKGGGMLSKLDIITGLYYRNPNGISSNQENLKKAIEEVFEIRKKYQ
jgi:glycosyltransferase involved in cell wall biosynthesis